MKRKTLFFLLGLLFLVPLSLRAYDFQSGDLYYNITSNTEPYTVEVTYKSITLQNNYAYLTTAVIPEMVTYNGTTYAVTNIGLGAFAGCTYLTSITISESVTSIGDVAFVGCTRLASITIPESVTSIGWEAFSSCTNLTSITIPESVTSIGANAFDKTPWYDNQPDGVLYIHTLLYTYKGIMPANTSISVKEGTTQICGWAFGNCSGLTSITIPESVTSIYSYAFSGCGITHICLPESITFIGSYILQNCPIEYIISLAETPISLEDNMIGLDKNTNDIPLLVPQNNFSAYKASPYWKEYNVQSQGFADITAIPTQTTASIKAKYIIFPQDGVQYGRLGYIFDGDTIWNDNLSDSISFVLTGLMPAETYSFGLLTDSMPTATQYTFTTRSVNMRINTTCTQTTARISLTIDCGDVPYIDRCGFIYYQSGYSSRKDTVFFETTEPITTLDTIMDGLTPYTEYHVIPFVDIEGIRYDRGTYSYFTTKDISVTLTCGTPTQTTIPLTLRYDFGDAEGNTFINGIEYCLGSQFTDNSDIQTIQINSMDSALSLDTIVRGLIPNKRYAFRPYVEIESIGRKYGAVKTAWTESISLNVSRTNKTQTTLSLQFTYNFGDADALNTGANGIEYCLGSQFTDDSDIQTIQINSMDSALSLDTIVRVLIPNTQYAFRPYVEIESIGRKYGVVKTAWTESISLNVSRTDKTQTTLSLQFTYNFGDADIDYIDGNLGDVKSFRFYPASSTGTIDTTFTHLRPGTEYTLSARAILTSGVSCGSTSGTYTTLPVSLGTPNVSEYGQTYVVVNSSCDYGDATLLRNILEFKRSQSSSAAIDSTINIIGTQTKVTNLLPNTTYYYRHLLETSEGGTQTTDWQEFATLPITLTTQIADGISNTSALLHGTVDCDQESYTEIGFEWKRSDAPATVKPQRLLVTDRVDENLLFRLEGLSSDRYYDFRTFCSYQGESYYGEWVGFLTSDKAVLVAPTVQTVGATANEQGAEMEGFIVTGTEPILQKGFEVWIKGGTDVKTTVAEGRIIRALIPEPWSYTTYQYKAYAKTASGTTYGETMEVTTGYIPRDVQDIAVTPSSNSAEVTWTEIEVADYYILTLFADEAMTETIAVYRVGTDGSISRLRMPSAVKALVTCSINDLLPDTDYYFAVVAYNGADQKVAEESGTFQTEPAPTGTWQATDEPSPAVRKILYRGQVFILRNGKTYTLTGQEIR